jgi:putative peptidoglycan lipid II flippase
LPTLAEYINAGKIDTFRETVNRALRVMLALCLPTAILLALVIRPLVSAFFGFEPTQLDLVTWCTWAFLFGLLGDAWLETAVRSFYANQNTRTPLMAAFFQVLAFILLAWLFSHWIGLAGIPLAAAISYTIEALLLLILLNRKFPGLLDMRGTLPRALLATLLGGFATFVGTHYLPVSQIVGVLFGISAGLIIILPLIWKEVRLLLRL